MIITLLAILLGFVYLVFFIVLFVSGIIMAQRMPKEIVRWMLLIPFTDTRAYGIFIPAPDLVIPEKSGEWSGHMDY